ncbi:MAG: type I-E CRISPR-associated endoribonuclease Cas2 [Ruminococcus sp.]|nr:type I-E CRISPR-associated endoribonuclease Cas2 [Ruminococcus sp.]
MIVITMSNCPPKLRGDLSLWLMEINTGVYVGQVNARVRESLWKRVCENLRDGQATMVFTTNNEQHMEFCVHNTSWKPVDYDGMKLMKRPLTQCAGGTSVLPEGFSTAAKQRMGRRHRNREQQNSYFVIDIETTGLSHEKDSILEVGMLEIKDGVCVTENEWLIRTDAEIPEQITRLTGLTRPLLDASGEAMQDVLQELLERTKCRNVIFYHANFDCLFLESACRKSGLPTPEFRVTDVMQFAKSKLKELANYKLETVARALGITNPQKHRALDDCKLLLEVWKKLNEM